MKYIYKLSWSILVKIGHEEEQFQSRESFHETKAGAEQKARDLKNAYCLLGFKDNFPVNIKEVALT